MATTVYTDGACLGNPGPGGWAWAVPGGAHASGADAATTNQRMELTAALEALRALPGPLVVMSDSTYVVNCHRDRWYEGWERKGWKNSKKEPVANQDLWKPMVELFRSRGNELSFKWVKGHSGDAMNDVVDRLAVEAAETQVGRSGSAPPTNLGSADQPLARRSAPRPSDRPSAGSAVPRPSDRPSADPAVSGPSLKPVDRPSADPAGAGPTATTGTGRTTVGTAPPAELPPGHRLAIFGHRPPELGGYGDNPVTIEVRRQLTEIFRGLCAVHPDLLVLTGLGLGAEQLGAGAAGDAGVAYVAVLAFANPEEVWPSASRDAYRRLLAGAVATVVLSNAKPTSKQEAGKAIGRRNDWLISHADGAVVVWDGRDRSLGETVTALERRLPDDVWVVAPPTNS